MNRIALIFERGFDAGIRLSDTLAKDMIAVKLFGPVRFVLCAESKYLNKFGHPKHPKDLLNHECLMVGKGTRIYDSWELEQKGKSFDVKVKPSIITNDSFIALDMILEPAGLMLVKAMVLMFIFRSGRRFSQSFVSSLIISVQINNKLKIKI